MVNVGGRWSVCMKSLCHQCSVGTGANAWLVICHSPTSVWRAICLMGKHAHFSEECVVFCCTRSHNLPVVYLSEKLVDLLV